MRNENKEWVLYYGSRKSAKLVRCYPKKELSVFRVEVELHSSLLRRNNVSTLDDLVHLPEIIYPKHLQFVEFDWRRLQRHLAMNLGDEGNQIVALTNGRAVSLQRLRRDLRRKGVVNIHRFLVPLPLNEEVSRALNKWARHFRRGLCE